MGSDDGPGDGRGWNWEASVEMYILAVFLVVLLLVSLVRAVC